MPALLVPFGTALILAYLLTPLVIRGAHRADILDVPIDDRRAHSVPVPRLGGVAVLLAIFLTWLGQSIAAGSPWNPLGLQYRDAWLGIVIGSGFIFFVGILDDIRGVSPRFKVIFQVSAAVSVVAYGLTPDTIALMPGASVWSVGRLVGAGIFTLWIVGVTNAFNLIDGLDGLAGSFALVALAIVMVSIAAINPGVSVVAPALIAGALLGFLRFNWHPARVFLGDSGSMTLGFLLSVLTVVSATDINGVTYPVIPFLALAFPLIDTFVAMARRWVRGVPFSLADGRHIHHQLRTAGLSVPETVRALSLMFCLISGFGLTILFAPPRFGAGLIVGGIPLLIAGTVYALRWLRYDEFSEFGSSVISILRQARQVVRIKIHTNEAVAHIKEASSVNDIREILDALANQVGLLDIELIEFGKKDAATPPSQQIARVDAQPMRLDYIVTLANDSVNRKIAVRFWRGINDAHHVHIMERVAIRIGPALNAWLTTHSVGCDSFTASHSRQSDTRVV